MNLSNGIKNITFSIIGQFVTLAIGIVIPRLVIVSYGSEYNGLLSSIGQVVSYLALLEAGIATASSQAMYKPIVQDDKYEVNRILASIHYYYRQTGIMYLLLILVIAIFYPLFINSQIPYWTISVLIVINGTPGVINYFFQGKYRILIQARGESYVLTNISTILSIVASVTKIIFLYFRFNIIFVQLIYCTTSLLQMIYVMLYIKKKYTWVNLKVERNLDALKQKWGALIHQIAGTITYGTDVVVLTLFCDLNTVSIYSLYNMIFNLVGNIVSSINGGVQYILGQTYGKSKALYIRVIAAYETYYIAISSALYVVAYILILPFFSLYTAGTDVDYLNVKYAMCFLWVKFLDASRSAASNTAYVSGHLNDTKKHAIVEAVINLGISIATVQVWGICGVLLGTIVAFMYRCIVSIWYANVRILHKSPLNSWSKWILNMTLIIIMISLFSKMNWYTESYIMLMWHGLGLTIVSMIVFLTVNSVIDYKSFGMISNVVIKRIKTIFSRR